MLSRLRTEGVLITLDGEDVVMVALQLGADLLHGEGVVAEIHVSALLREREHGLTNP